MSLHREVDDLSERLLELLATTETSSAQAAIIRSLLLWFCETGRPISIIFFQILHLSYPSVDYNLFCSINISVN